MLEVAITSIKCALRDDYPEFKDFYENEGWKPKEEPAVECDEEKAACESEGEVSEPAPVNADAPTDPSEGVE